MLSGSSASLLVPADSTLIFVHVENTCSTVGLRSLFWLQMKRILRNWPATICSTERIVERNGCRYIGMHNA